MAVYSAVRGSNARIYIGESLFCTAKSVEIITEQALHEVYECFSTEPNAIIKGRKKYKAVLEKIVVESMDKALSFLELDNFTVKIAIDGKATILDGCVWSNDNLKLESENIIEKLAFSALERSEGDNGREN